jgi:hypothetical protein
MILSDIIPVSEVQFSLEETTVKFNVDVERVLYYEQKK